MFRSNVTSQYFNGSMTAETMKKLHRKLVMQYHPDLNKNVDIRIIQTINAEYSYWYARAASEEVYTRKSEENPDKQEYYQNRYRSREYIDSLENMIKWILDNNIDRIDGITVELIGVFIWIGGVKKEDVEIREKIKSVGFRGSWKETYTGDKVYMYKYTPDLRSFLSEKNIDKIRSNYGTQDIKRKNTQKRLN